MKISLWADGPTLCLSEDWQLSRTPPADPPDGKHFGFLFTDGSAGSVVAHAISPEDLMPLDRDTLIEGIRGAQAVVSGDAGLVEADAARTASGVPYVYSIMKIRAEPTGVQYNLTLQLVGDRVVLVQGHFAEGNRTGVREATVYEVAMRRNWVTAPNDENPTGGWAHDPYDGSTTGFVMNMSELPDFDQQFPGHPLTMARELLQSVADS